MSAAAMAAIRSEAEQAYPWEVCGVLVGRAGAEGWEAVLHFPVQNECGDWGRSRFRIPASDLVRIAGEARLHGLEIAGFYHSHPDAEACWSVADLDEAHWPGCCWLILPVRQGRAGHARAFALREEPEGGKRFDEERIVSESPSE